MLGYHLASRDSEFIDYCTKQDFISLRDHFNTVIREMDLRYKERFDGQTKARDAAFLAADKAVQAALTAADKATTKAEIASEKRFDAVNEFRAAYQDIISQQMPRTEYLVQHKSLNDKIDGLENRFNKFEGRGVGISSSWSFIIAAIGGAAGLVAIIYYLSHLH